MFKKELYVGVVVLLLALLFTGCTVGSPESGVAQKVADAFYQARQDQDMEKALSFYSDKRTAEEWRGHLEHMGESLGTVQSFALKHTEVNTVLSGRLYIFDYQVNYSSGKGAKETLTLFDSVEADDSPLIESHMVSADGYRPLF